MKIFRVMFDCKFPVGCDLIIAAKNKGINKPKAQTIIKGLIIVKYPKIP